MLKKFFTLFLAFSFMTVQADAVTNNNLKSAFDDLNYSLIVDWDQKDRTFYNQQMEKFAAEVKTLQFQGLTNQQLVDFTVAQIKDQKMANDLRNAFTVVTINKMSAAEAHNYVTDVMNKSYSQGASWAGEVIVGAVILVVFIAVAAIVAGRAKVDDGCYQVYTCEQDCAGSFCVENCDYHCI